mgnify:CR=1 FL=1
MGERILDWIGEIISGPKRRFFWAFVIVALVIGVIVFPYIDANFLYYDRIEKRIGNLQDMVALSGMPLEENEALKVEYQSILAEMETAREKALSNATNSEDTLHDRRAKFFAGAGLWYIVAVAVLFIKKKTEKWSFKKVFNNFCSATLCLGIGSGIGWIFTLIPTLGIVEVNAVLTLILEVVVLWLLIEQPKKKASTSGAK